MTHGSLFSGIGGFDLAAQWMGWENKFHCEWDKFCQTVLKYYWPHAETYGDINKADFTIWRGRIDVISGGEPCQPHSKSGKQLGKADTRYLWPQKFNAIRIIKPTWVVNENVRGSINTGALDTKIRDLGNEGYTCWPPLLMPTGAQALSERYRVWLVAHSNENAISNNDRKVQDAPGEVKSKQQGENREWMRPVTESILNEHNWEEVASSLCGGIDGVPKRMDRIGALGNAIDPRIAYHIFQVIASQIVIGDTSDLLTLIKCK